MPETSFDVIVIGAGPTGENVADRVVRGGLSAAIVESNLVGGECSYAACMPSKALLRSPAALDAARRVDGARQAVTGRLDTAAVFARRTRFTNNWNDESQVKWLDDRGIKFFRGHGRLAGERKVAVAGSDGATTMLETRQAVVIATGSDPAIPPIAGVREASPWTNREATRAGYVPQRLAILGGGVVACEMAVAWCSLGSKVTVLERNQRVLDRMEPFASDRVLAALKARGVDVHLGVQVTRVEREIARGPVKITLDRGGKPIEADELLVATGRVPSTHDLGLETVGLRPGEWLEVNDSCCVAAVESCWLYAAGDVNHRALLTHMGKYQGRACGDAIVARAKGLLGSSPPARWSKYTATADHAFVPQVIFTDPEVASIGLTEAEARKLGIRARAVEYDIAHVSGAALVADGYSGWAKMVVDEDRRVIVGVTLVGQDVGELIHAATVAVVGEIPLDRLWHAVPSYPTISEIWLRLLETYGL